MDCLRSGLDDAGWPDIVAALDGRPGGVVWELVGPKKSSPNRESPGLVDLSGAAAPFGGCDLDDGGSVVLGLGTGAVSSPKRSTAGAALLTCGS